LNRKRNLVPHPIKNKAHLAARRRRFLLGPFRAYAKRLALKQERLSARETERKRSA
jgi:hypothetical protein